jgi:hypothetical protein
MYMIRFHRVVSLVLDDPVHPMGGRGAGGAVGTLLKNLQGEIAMIMAGGNANHDHDGHGGANPHAAPYAGHHGGWQEASEELSEHSCTIRIGKKLLLN